MSTKIHGLYRLIGATLGIAPEMVRAALAGESAFGAQDTDAIHSKLGAYKGFRSSSSREKGKAQPAGSKLRRAAARHRLGLVNRGY